MKPLIRYMRKRAVVVVALVIVVVAAVTTLAFAAADSNQKPTIAPPPLTLPLPTPVDLPPSFDDGNCTSCRLATLMQEFRENAAGKSAEEVAVLEQELFRQMETEGLGKMIDLDSPEAWGAEIEIAGKIIKLPDDARVKTILGEILVGHSSDGKCYGCEAAAEVPITCIERGDSLVSIGRTGVVLSGNIAPGEIGVFDFLKEVLTDQKATIDSLPVRAPVKDAKLRIVNLDDLNIGYENMSQSLQGGSIRLSPSPSPPAYEYLSQDLTLNDTIPPVGPPKKNFGMFVWQVYQNVPVYWRTTDDNVRPEAVTVITNWENVFPELDWDMVSETPNVDIFGTVIDPPDAVGGIGYKEFFTFSSDSYNARYPYRTEIYLNTLYNWTDAGVRGALAHEIGHHYGLGERYLSDYSCNPNEVTVMDSAVLLDGNPKTVLWGCDQLEGPGPELQSQDRPRIRAYWYQGLYTDWTAQANGAIATFTWKDASWADQKEDIQVFYSDGRGWVFYFGSSIYKDIGLHKTIENRTITQVLDVTQYGAPLQTWHCACGRPWLAGSDRYGTWTCESMYMP